eukprot:1157013-Pelagomonas_calceolata.AAC.12
MTILARLRAHATGNACTCSHLWIHIYKSQPMLVVSPDTGDYNWTHASWMSMHRDQGSRMLNACKNAQEGVAGEIAQPSRTC